MNDLEKMLNEIEAGLKYEEEKPFSSKAFALYKEKISIYITRLYNESLKTCNRNKADNVSASHVENASQYLIKSPPGRIESGCLFRQIVNVV